METEIRQYIKEIFTENQVLQRIEDEIASGDWLNDYWEDEADDEFEWYRNYGRGEIETQIIDEIIDKVAKRFFNNNFDFYYKSLYGDINSFIYEAYPMLEC